MHTKINWFEIPATDFGRAVKFYEQLFNITLKVQNFAGFQMGVIGGADGNSVGAVMHGDQYIAGGDGVVIYLDANPSIDAVIGRIESSGGRLKIGKTVLPDGMGLVAYFFDSEGNRLALHAMQ